MAKAKITKETVMTTADTEQETVVQAEILIEVKGINSEEEALEKRDKTVDNIELGIFGILPVDATNYLIREHRYILDTVYDTGYSVRKA